MRLLLTQHPDRLDAEHPLPIEELLELEQTGHQAAVSTMIGMLKDLHQNGRACRFLKNLTGTPAWELRPAVRGGERGGSRVNCEIKPGDAASREKLRAVLQVIVAFKKGVRVFEDP